MSLRVPLGAQDRDTGFPIRRVKEPLGAPLT